MLLVGRQLKMPIPARLVLRVPFGASGYMGRAQLDIRRLNCRHHSFKAGGWTGQRRRAMRVESWQQQVVRFSRTALAVQLAVHGEAASLVREKLSVLLRAARTLIAPSFMRCNKHADGFSANRPILYPSSRG